MEDTPSDESNNQSNESPAPEVLHTREGDASEETEAATVETRKKSNSGKVSLRARYHLSHKATFIGIAVVVAILAINAGIIAFVLRGQSESDSDLANDQVTINQDVLNKLGVNRSAVDDLGVELIVGPNARFEKEVQIGGNVSIGGELTLNDRFLAANAELASLQAGDTSLEQLNVNGDGTLTNISVRNDLTVVGTGRFQGPVTVSQLLTAEGSVNVSQNLTVGGALSVNSFHSSSLTVDNTFTLGGHIITRGSAPSVSAGSASGSNGTVSISGNDVSGTVVVNAGAGAGGGTVATVSFRNSYSNIPHVSVTPVGNSGYFHISRNADGFSIIIPGSLPPGGYAFDYIVVQ